MTLAALPVGRVVHLGEVDPGRITLLAAHGGPQTPAVLSHHLREAGTLAGFVVALLDDLEGAAVELFPAWLPEAEHIDSPGGAGITAVRALAGERAATTTHFGPFLADLAERALSGVPVRRRFSLELRARGLARAVADGLGRARLAVVVPVPAGLSADQERTVASGAEWLADRAALGVWLCGAPLATIDRLSIATVLPGTVPTATVLPRTMPTATLLPVATASGVRPGVSRAVPGAGHAGTGPATEAVATHGGTFAGVIGHPHPRSGAETALETALARHPWAGGRAWNQTYQSHALTSPVRLDLLWRTERCVVEIDGPEHCRPAAFEADRQRDVQLQLDGFAVLRFTNARVRHDVDAVVRQIGSFIDKRRHELLRGHKP